MDKEEYFDLIADVKKRKTVKDTMEKIRGQIDIMSTLSKLTGDDPVETEYDERMKFIIAILQSEKEKFYCGRKVANYSEFSTVADKFEILFKQKLNFISQKENAEKKKVFGAFQIFLTEYLQKGLLTDNFNEPYATPENISSILSKDIFLKKYADLFQLINSFLESFGLDNRYAFIKEVGIDPTISNAIRHSCFVPEADKIIFLNEDKKEFLRMNNETYVEKIAKRIYFTYAGIAEGLAKTFSDKEIRKEIVSLQKHKKPSEKQ